MSGNPSIVDVDNHDDRQQRLNPKEIVFGQASNSNPNWCFGVSAIATVKDLMMVSLRHSRQICPGFAAFVLVCFLVSTAFGQVAAERGNMTPLERCNRMVSFAEREMALELTRLVAIDDAFEKLRPTLFLAGKPIAKTAGERRAANKELPTFILRNFPDPSVSKAFGDKAKSLVSEESATRYLEDVADRRKFFELAYSDLLVGMVDQQVNLTPNQIEEISERLKRSSWLPFTHPHLHHYDWNWGIKPPAEFVAMDFPELTKLQQDSWATRTELLQALPTRKNLDDDFEEFKTRCQKAIEFKVQILAEQYDLPDATTRRLKVAGKGVSSKLATAWRDAWSTRMEQDRGTLWLTSNRRFTQYSDLFDLIESQSQWHKRVLSVLNEQQQETYNERLEDRAVRAHQAAWRCWVVCWSLRLGFTANQESDLFELVSSQLPIDPTGTRASHANWERLGSIPKEAFEKAIGQKHAAELEARELGTWREIAKVNAVENAKE